MSPRWLITELGISWCQYSQSAGNQFGPRPKPLIKISEHKVSWATVLMKNTLSICIGDQQHETSDLPSEKEATAQKHETLLSNDLCRGKLLLSLGLMANFLTERLYYRNSFGLCSSVGGNHKIASDRIICYVSLALV